MFYLTLVMSLWNNIVEYYTVIGEKYHVNPIIFVGIHIIATPLFAAAASWIIYNRKNKKSILIPAVTAVFIFNAASIYLIIFGKAIPYYIYLIVAVSTLLSGFFAYRKIKKKMLSSK